MKPSESAQIEFIKDLLRKGSLPKAILAEFVKKWRNVSKRTFERRLKVAGKDVQGEQQRIQTLAEGEVAKKVEALESKIMSAIELQVYLAGIVTCKTDIKIIGKAGVPILVHDDGRKEIITQADKLKAADLFCKLIGAYSPDKHEHKLEGDLPSWLKLK